MTVLGAPAGPPPPSADSRHGWPPPPDIEFPPINPDQEDDPWASWYGKPRGQRGDTPSATLPRVQQGYGPGQPYADDTQYDGQSYPGQPYPGQPYPGQQPYATEQYQGQQYPGQQYPGQQYGGPQQYGQYGDGQEYPGAMTYAGSQPYPPGGPRGGLRSKKGLIPGLAIGGVAVIAIVALIVANSGGGTPNQAGGTGSAGPTTTSAPPSDAAQKAAAQQLAALLPQSGSDHAAVNAAYSDLSACKRLKSARTALASATQNRQNLLAQIRSLPGKDALPAGLVTALTGAEQASAQVDGHLHGWAQDLINGGCDPKTAKNDPEYQASLPGDTTATNDKAAFIALWTPLAQKYGLQAYTSSQI
jgi:hypothetical protein